MSLPLFSFEPGQLVTFKAGKETAKALLVRKINIKMNSWSRKQKGSRQIVKKETFPGFIAKQVNNGIIGGAFQLKASQIIETITE